MRLRSIPVLVALVLCCAPAAQAASVSGTVQANGRAAASWNVNVWAGGPTGATVIGSGKTDGKGSFAVGYPDGVTGSVLYAIASDGEKRMLSVLGPPTSALDSAFITEETTIGAVFSLSRFLDGSAITGPAPGLPNAAAGVSNLVETRTGKVSFVLANQPNGVATSTLATFNTLANALAGCTGGDHGDCESLFKAAAPPRGASPRNTIAAAQALALNPTTRPTTIQRLGGAGPFEPSLEDPPDSWALSLVFTDGGTNAPGRMAFDAQGRIWIGNNFQSPGTMPGLGMTVLSPTGQPILGSPIVAGGLQGVGYGTAVDRLGRVWQANFGSSTISLFDSGGAPIDGSPFGAATTSKPQGVSIDRSDNVWVANFGNGTVSVYRGGDPSAPPQVISGGGLSKPFDIAHDPSGNAYVSNGAESLAPGSVTKISPDGLTTKKITGSGMRSPQGITTDSGGNAWMADLASSRVVRVDPSGATKAFKAGSIHGPWGMAVDGDDNVWVAGFINQNVTQLCGRIPANCPPGTRTGEPISPEDQGFTNAGVEHITAVQVDASGNVWLANNWSSGSPLKKFVGGNGLVEIVGAAAPVKTPLLGSPQQP